VKAKRNATLAVRVVVPRLTCYDEEERAKRRGKKPPIDKDEAERKGKTNRTLIIRILDYQEHPSVSSFSGNTEKENRRRRRRTGSIR